MAKKLTIQRYSFTESRFYTVDVRALFKRMPDDVVLATATRTLNLQDDTTCLCGWAVREDIASTLGRDARRIDPYRHMDSLSGIPDECAKRFGGEYVEWSAVFSGVTDSGKLPTIETAWVERVQKAVARA